MILLLLIWLLILRMVLVVNRWIYWVFICLFYYRKECGVIGFCGGGFVCCRLCEVGYWEWYFCGGGLGYGRGCWFIGLIYVGILILWRGGFNIKYYN